MNPQELRIKNIIRWQDESEDAVEVLSIELYEDTGEYHIVYHALTDGEPDGSAMLFDFEGIPLTESWLERGGFEKQPSYSWNGNGEDYQVSAEEGGSTTTYEDYVKEFNNGFFIYRIETFAFKGSIEKSISLHFASGYYKKVYESIQCTEKKFLHEFQNLIYSLTNQELTFK